MLEVVDFTQFKRGMLGLLKLLMYEAMQSQRLDHYAMYKTMQDITEAWEGFTDAENDMEAAMQEDEEAIARMILNFPKDASPRDASDPEEPPKDTGTDYV